MGIVQWLLKRFDHRKTEHAAERRIRNTAGETEVAQFVVPIVKYDVNTGEFKNFDEWDDDMTFNGDLTINGNITYTGYQFYYKDMELTGDFRLLTVGDKIEFGDLDTEIYEAIDDELIVTTSGAERLKVLNAGIQVTGDVETTDDVIVGDDIYMGLNQWIYLDDDNDSGFYCDIDDRVRLVTGGITRQIVSTTSINYYLGANFQGNDLVNLGVIQLDEISDPSALAGHGKLWCKDNAGQTELWFIDDAGVKTQIV